MFLLYKNTGCSRRANREWEATAAEQETKRGLKLLILICTVVDVLLVVGVGDGDLVYFLRGERAGLIILAGLVITVVVLFGLMVSGIRFPPPGLTVLRGVLS